LKRRFKLSILVIGIMTVLITGVGIAAFSVLLLQRASSVSIGMSTRELRSFADRKIEYIADRKDSHIRVLRMLAHLMEDYEYIPPPERRERFDALLYRTVTYEEDMITLYTVWKPDALDGMDTIFIAGPGSCPVTGQYASAFTRETGEILQRLTTDLEGAMQFLAGPGSRKDRVEHLIPGKIGGNEAYLFNIMVPVINPRSNEVVGGVGGTLSIGRMQALVEESINSYDEIAVKALYGGDGRILASYQPDRIGSMLVDVDTIYGNRINEAHRAVLEGREFQFKSHCNVLDANVVGILRPLTIGYSDATWALMVGFKEGYMLAGVHNMTKFTILLALTSMLVSGIIVISVLMFITRPMLIVTERLKNIPEIKGGWPGHQG